MHGIITACRNEEKFAKQYIEHVKCLLAADSDLHISIVDDGSSDKTPKMLKKAFGKSPNVSLYFQETHVGVSACRNKAVSILPPEVKWLHFLDADDTFLDYGMQTRKRIVENFTTKFKTEKPIGIFYYPFLTIHHSLQYGDYMTYWRNIVNAKRVAGQERQFMEYEFLTLPIAMTISRDAFALVGGFHEDIVKAEEHALLCSILDDTEYGIMYYEVPTSMYHRYESTAIREHANIFTKHKEWAIDIKSLPQFKKLQDPTYQNLVKDQFI